MKRKILVSVLLIGLVTVLIAGGTFAYFTSTVTNSGNSILAGTLSLTSGSSTVFTSEIQQYWSPGTSQTGTITLTNSGNLPIGAITLQAFYITLPSGRSQSGKCDRPEHHL
jgi:spore coat-associated protein N